MEGVRLSVFLSMVLLGNCLEEDRSLTVPGHTLEEICLEVQKRTTPPWSSSITEYSSTRHNYRNLETEVKTCSVSGHVQNIRHLANFTSIKVGPCRCLV